MGWERPQLAPMVCDCCRYVVQPEFGDSPDGTETVPKPHEWGFVWMGEHHDVGEWNCFPTGAGELWCDDCVELWEEALKKLPESGQKKLDEDRVETEGQPMLDALYPSFQAKRKLEAVEKMAAELFRTGRG